MFLFEYDAIDPKTVNVDFSKYNPKNPNKFISELSKSVMVQNGTIAARSPEDAVTKLNRMGLIPVRLSLVTGNKDGALQLIRLKEFRNSLFKTKSSKFINIWPYTIIILLTILFFIWSLS